MGHSSYLVVCVKFVNTKEKKHLCYKGNRKIVTEKWENVLHKAANDRIEGVHKQSVRKAGSGNKHGISKFAGVK